MQRKTGNSQAPSRTWIGPRMKVPFGAFPGHSGLDPVAECRTNIATMGYLTEVAQALVDETDLADAIERQDAKVQQWLKMDYPKIK